MKDLRPRLHRRSWLAGTRGDVLFRSAPAILTLVLSLQLAAAVFVVPAGYPVSQAVFQALLYALGGSIIVCMTIMMTRQRRHTREALELAPDAYFLADLDARLMDVNQAACRLLGYERDELIGKTVFDIVPPEDAERLRAIRTELLVPGNVNKSEWLQRRKDGTFVPVEVSTNILNDGRWQAFARDITRRRRGVQERERLLVQEKAAREQAEAANAKLRESEDRFRLAFDNAPIGMALVALDGRFVRVNQVLCQITGYSAEELTSMTFPQVTHPDDVGIDHEQLRELREGTLPRYHLEKRYIRKDGSVVHIMLSRSVLRDAHGNALYYVTQMEDITARKRAEEALRISEARFSGIVSIAADAIISVDGNQRIMIFNEGAEKIFGYGRDEAIGMSLDRLIPERLRATHAARFAAFAEGRETARVVGERREVFGLRRNGEEFPAEASISKVGVDGSMIFSVVLRDITHRKSVEQKLEHALAARDDVLRIVAHDLRNPLSTITMQASALERPGPEPERRDQKARLVIVRSAKRMNSLIQDLLDVVLVEAGELKVERERLSAADLAREAVESQALLASAAGLELRLELGGDIPLVCGDRKRLLQVFDNLLGNAIKFTPKGGCITLTAAVTDAGALRFAVTDTGPGITPENVPHVFDRFWQAATRERRLGAGLGLPITKGIVEAHGGRIWLESTVGRGSTFFFTIPCASPKAGMPTDGGAEPRRQSSPGNRVGRPRTQRV